MDARRYRLHAAALALTFAAAACGGSHTESGTREIGKYVAAAESCPSTDAVEESEEAWVPGNQEITSVDFTGRVTFAARARVCWYRVTYSDPSAETRERLPAKTYQETRDGMCPARAQRQNFEATRARYLSEHSGERRMTCFKPPQNVAGLESCLERSSLDTFECVEDALIVAQRQGFEIPCKTAGQELRPGSRVVELAAEDELPDMAACFFRIGYDIEVSDKVGSFGYGPR